ncbi:MAG: mandelate racemase/muconate lactonizing enzyme family protein [Chloroflexota bacterium]|nr:mandelate racemase/muconate lactonizing enzyme family protein [Chloroflexota bacterium]
MKIRDVKVYPIKPDISEGRTRERQVGWVFVQIETDEGITGVGECTNWPRKGDIIVSHIVQVLKESLIGQDPSHIEKLWHEMYRNYTYLGSRGPITTAISGINIALWDIKGKALGKPVYDLLGGPVRDSLLLYVHPRYGTPKEVADSGVSQVAEGYTALKTDPFQAEMVKYHTAYLGGYISREGEREGVRVIEALRNAVGPDIEILIDAHGHYNVATAVRCIRALQPYNITWFEEPVPPEGLDALRQVRAQTDMDLCTGERLYTRWDYLPVLREGLANYIMSDVCWTGGISELKKIATLAETYFVPVSPHQAMGPIQIIAGAHVMLTTPNFYRLEMVSRWMKAFNDCISPALDVRGGALYLSNKPGLGVELNMDYVKRHPDPDWAG